MKTTSESLDALDKWHLELAILFDLNEHILNSLEDCPPWVSSGAYLVSKEFKRLIDTFPMPTDK